MIDDLGATSLRTYHSIGLNSKDDHGGFLDRAKDLGLHVMAGYHTQMVCGNDFNCFQSWKDATAKAFQAGFMPPGNKTWHSAVSMLILMEQPDGLDFVATNGELNCSLYLNQSGVPKQKQVMNRCWLKAVLSAMDGVLAAEQEAGVNATNSPVKLAVAWTGTPRDSIDGVVKGGTGYFGFRDVMVGAKDPNGTVGYMPVVGNKTLLAAFKNRWVHATNTESPYKMVKDTISAGVYNQFLPNPWFISSWSTNKRSEAEITSNLQAIANDASANGPFLGASVSQFQKEYQVDGVENGLFDLGPASNAKMNDTDTVCDEDVKTKSPVCSKGGLPVYCLQQSSDVQRASGVASAFGGKVQGRGLCQSEVELFI
jgi:hypothetical protein